MRGRPTVVILANDKPRDVVLGHEVPHIRRQKQRLIDIPGAKVLAHSPSLNQTRWDLNSDYSDRLLAGDACQTRRMSLGRSIKLPDRQVTTRTSAVAVVGHFGH